MLELEISLFHYLTFKSVRYIPAWFPGAGFIEICQAYKRRAEAFSDVPYEFVRQQMDTSVCVPSFLSNLLQKCEVGPGSEEERIIKWSAGSLYAGGADTVRGKLTPCRNGIHEDLQIARQSLQSPVSFSLWPFTLRCNRKRRKS